MTETASSSSGENPLIVVRDLSKSFGTKRVLQNASFAIPSGSISCILGRSGSGKSVLLRLLVGLLQADSGTLLYQDQPLTQPQILRRFRSECGYVFQQNALLDFLTVAGNVALPLLAQSTLPEDQHRHQILRTLAALELDADADRYPAELSGGMQKRVAVARALVTHPKVILFDEPTAGLDPIRRNAVFQQILHLRNTHQFTALIVTHDVPEALAVADQILWVDQQTIRFTGSPSEFKSLQDPDAEQFRDNIRFLKQSPRPSIGCHNE